MFNFAKKVRWCCPDSLRKLREVILLSQNHLSTLRFFSSWLMVFSAFFFFAAADF